MTIPSHWPVLGICGYSGAGKTTLIEELIPRLRRDGLAVAVVKHDAHRMTVDTPGKDTDRLFRAGATVFAHDPQQAFLRRPVDDTEDVLPWAVGLLLRDHDVVLVEGHKATALPAKLWLRSEAGEAAPAEAGPMLASLGRADDRVAVAYRLLSDWLADLGDRRPVLAEAGMGGR